MNNKNLKVFKMNEYEWWATKGSAEDLNDYYTKYVDDNDIEEVELCDLDKDGMWYYTKDKKDIEELDNFYELISYEPINGIVTKKVKFGDLKRYCGDIYKYISFREALKLNGDFTEPYCIACTEW